MHVYNNLFKNEEIFMFKFCGFLTLLLLPIWINHSKIVINKSFTYVFNIVLFNLDLFDLLSYVRTANLKPPWLSHSRL